MVVDKPEYIKEKEVALKTLKELLGETKLEKYRTAIMAGINELEISIENQ